MAWSSEEMSILNFHLLKQSTYTPLAALKIRSVRYFT